MYGSPEGYQVGPQLDEDGELHNVIRCPNHPFCQPNDYEEEEEYSLVPS
jgi:hypothetical protein